MKNKIWIGAILSFLLIAVLPMFAKAEAKVLDSQKWQGGPLTWTVYDNGTLEITGKGEFKEKTGYPWAIYYDEITNVVIGNGVTNIPARAFQAMKNIKTVSLGNSVQSIGESAFNSCYALEKINMPSSLVSIGKNAFCECISLEKVDFAKAGKLKEIGESAFERCGITAFSPNDELVTIGAYAFLQCSALRTVNLPDSLQTLGNYAFAECESLSWFRIGSVPNIGEYVLNKSRNLEYLELHTPAKYEFTYDGFSYQKKLKCIVLGEGWDELERFCHGCPELTTVVLPDSVKRIWGDSFSDCPKLTNINMPASLERIEPRAFAGSGLTGVILPDSVKYIGSGAFMGCPELRYFIGGASLARVDGYAVSNCPKLETVCLGNVKEIQVGALSNNANITNVIWSDKLECIGENVFENCVKLPYAVFPESLTLLDSGAFGGCSALEDVYFLGDAPTFGEERVFWKINVNAHYSQSNATWTADVMDKFADQLTWQPLCQDHTEKAITPVSATCVTVGLSGGEECDECGLILATQTIEEPLEHHFTQKVSTADCLMAGFTTHTCQDCGYSYKDQVVSALAHKWTGWESKNNQLQCECTVCKQVFTRRPFYWVYLQSDPNYKKPTVTQTVPSRPSTTTVQTEPPTQLPTTEPSSALSTSGSVTTVPSTTADEGVQQIDPMVEEDVKAIAIMLLAIAIISLVTMGILIYIKLTKKDEKE